MESWKAARVSSERIESPKSKLRSYAHSEAAPEIRQSMHFRRMTVSDSGGARDGRVNLAEDMFSCWCLPLKNNLFRASSIGRFSFFPLSKEKNMSSHGTSA